MTCSRSHWIIGGSERLARTFNVALSEKGSRMEGGKTGDGCNATHHG